MQPIHSSIIDCNHGKKYPWTFITSNFQLLFHTQLPRIVLNSAAQEAAKSSEFDLTSYAPQQLQIFARSLYNIIMLQNSQNQTEKVLILIQTRWSSWHIVLYEMTEKPTATTTKCFEPLFIIILNNNRLLVW